MTPAPAGERYNEVKGYYFERRRATIPASIGTRAAARRRHRQRGRQGRRPAAGVPLPRRGAADVPRTAGQEARAGRRRRGLHGQVAERRPAGYATAPRYLDAARRRARGRRLRGRDLQHRRPAGQRRHAERRRCPQIKYPTHLGVLSHFDAVNYYSGDDFVPQDVTNTDPRRLTSRDGADRLARDGAAGSHKVMLELREYANEGGKLLVDGRNVHQAFTVDEHEPVGAPARTPGRRTSCSASSTRRTTRATTTCPARPGSARAASSNDTWQNYLGVVGRQSGIGARGQRHRRRTRHRRRAGRARRPAACSPAWPRSRSTRRPANEPNQTPTARRCRWPRSRCACATGRPDERAAARRSDRGRLRHHPGAERPRAARSSRRVTR